MLGMKRAFLKAFFGFIWLTFLQGPLIKFGGKIL
jgi:hypothetical protein